MGSVKGTAMETTETPDGAHVAKSSAVDVPGELDAAVPQVEVVVGLGFTQPTVPYGNTKYYVSIKIPCNLGEHDQIADFAEEWVSDRCEKARQAVIDNS